MIPVCKTIEEKRCSEEIISKLEVDQEKYCPKMCNIKEYRLEKDKSVEKRIQGQTGFTYHFVLPEATRDLRFVLNV